MAGSPQAEPRPRRQEQRLGRRREGPLRCWVEDGQVDRFASLADLSREGARLFTVAPPPVGERVTLRMRLRPEGTEVCAEARVVWRAAGAHGRGGVMGVRFVSVDGVDEITAYVGEE